MAMCHSCGTETGVNSKSCTYCGAVITDREVSRTALQTKVQQRGQTPARVRMFGAWVVSALVFFVISFVLYARR
jgi:uncharacterized membrane protein YvbJ